VAGELQDLKNELNGDTKERRKNAIKKTIASMTVGKDVGPLFPDVLKNMQAEDLETKKLVYLYLMNYAKSHPEIAILAVNTFVKARTHRPIRSPSHCVCTSCRRVERERARLCVLSFSCSCREEGH
jgi:AP-1 complex subunit beta-1